jgi:RNA polymerase-binding transcription factor DksA
MTPGLTAGEPGTLTAVETPADDDVTAVDLDAIEAELAAVEASLERLDAGTYGLCEVSGAPLPDALLEADPTARRNTGLATS